MRIGLAAAGGKNLEVFSPTIGRQLLERGLIDAIDLHIAPVLLGEGIRLYDNPGGEPIPSTPQSAGSTTPAETGSTTSPSELPSRRKQTMIDMPRESRRTIQEVHQYLLTQLNLALRRPGMYGGEIALRLYMDATAFADDREAAWQEELEKLRTRDCFPSTGVRGAFRQLWGDDHEGAVSSVYAEIAHRQGWLELDRTLSTAEYDEILRTSKSWCTQDRFLSEVYTTFGPPSVLFGGTNLNFPKTLAYSTDRPKDPLICFHLWNDFASRPSTGSVPIHAEPALLAVRSGGTRFADGFTFTPEGTSRRQLSEAPNTTQP